MNNIARNAVEEMILAEAKERSYTHDEVVSVVNRAMNKIPRSKVVKASPQDADVNFCIRFATLRRKTGLTVEEFSRDIEKVAGEEFKTSTIYRLESAEQRPRMREVQAVSLYFDIPIDQLIAPFSSSPGELPLKGVNIH